MSNKMLEQAIIDANALREVALKNAESVVVEKYSQQIKEAVDNMLEQDEDEMMGAEEEMPMDPMADPAMGAEAPPSDIAAQAPLAATDGERLCPCPEEEEPIEVDFNQLQDMMKALDSEDEDMMPQPTPDEMLPPEDEEGVVALQEGDDTLIDLILEEDDEDDEDDKAPRSLDDGPEVTLDARTGIEEDEEIIRFFENTDADDEDDDMGMPKDAEADEAKEEDAEAASAAATNESLLHAKKVLSEHNKINKENSKLISENKNLKEVRKSLVERNKELKKLLHKISYTLEEVNLSNAKLVYTNQILGSDSLNERQKNKIVETINEADSVEAAKSVFETLQSAVGTSLESRNGPKSLSEAVVKGNTTMLRRKEKQSSNSPHLDRMKKLAGI
jgi:hypothetical protein